MSVARCFVVLVLAINLAAQAQGPLAPSGAPAPTMKTLAQVEPRTPISAAATIISDSGSYYLTTNIYGTGTQRGITISANDVTLDLGGFAIAGLTNSTMNGIYIAGNFTNIVIRNGIVRGWGGSGIDGYSGGYPRNVVYENLVVANNGNSGIYSEAGSVVRNCEAFANGGSGIYSYGGRIVGCQARTNRLIGIYAGVGSTVEDSVSEYNGTNGIELARNGTVRNCSANANGGVGILGGDAAAIIESAARANLGNGIQVGNHSTVRDCLSNANQDGITAGHGSVVESCTVSASRSGGIEGGESCQILHCTSTSNTYQGIITADGSLIEGNVTSHNRYSGIIVVSKGNRIVGNTCSYDNSISFSLDGGITAEDHSNVIDGNTVMYCGRANIHINGGYSNNLIIRNMAIGDGTSNYIYNVADHMAPIAANAATTYPFANFSN